METILSNLIFAFFLTPFVYYFKKEKNNIVENLLFSFGLSVGIGTLFLFYILILSPHFFIKQIVVTIPFATLILSGIYVIYKKPIRSFKLAIPRLNNWEGICWLTIFIFFLYILIDNFFKPIFEWDTLARYAYWGNRIFELKQIDSVEIHFPLLVPLTLAYSFLVSGGYNDYLTKLIPALFSIAAVIATYLLGKELFSGKIGTLAAFFISNTSMFVFWSSRVYVDIPQMFYTLIFLYSLYKYLYNKSLYYAIYSGLFLSFAIWSKQSAIITYVCTIILFVTLIVNRKLYFIDKNPQFSFKTLTSIFLLPIILVGYWYFRDYILTKEILWQGAKGADRSIETLLPFISQPGLFNEFLSPMYFISLILIAPNLIVNSSKSINVSFFLIGVFSLLLVVFNLVFHFLKEVPLGLMSRYMILVNTILGIFCLLNKDIKVKVCFNWVFLFILVFLIPYYFTIWWDYTFESRYWIALIPFFAIISAYFVNKLLDKYLNVQINRVILVVILFLAFTPNAIKLIGHDFFFQPNVSDRYKKDHLIGSAYEYFLRLRSLSLPQDSTVLTHDGRVATFVPKLRYANQQPLTITEKKNYDNFFVTPFTI